MKVVTLKNGAEEPEPIVKATMLSLQTLLREDVTTFYELAMKCRDSNHEFWGDSADKLKRLVLVQEDGRVNQSVRNVVLSAVEGELLDMRLVSPIS